MVGDDALTYGRLCGDIDAMANWLSGNGLEPGMRISIHPSDIGRPGYWDWIAHLGAIRAGLVHSTGSLAAGAAVRTALGPNQAAVGWLGNWKPHRGFSGKQLAFAPETLAPLAEQLGISMDDKPLETVEEHAGRVLKTSGTTGNPKLVLWDSSMIAARLAQIREIDELGPSTCLLPLLGFPTTAGFRYPLAVWQAGGSVILPADGDKGSGLVKSMAGSTLVIASPFRFRGFLGQVEGEIPGREGRVLKLFGGRLPPLLRDAARKRVAGTVMTSYGSTETGSVATGDASHVDRHPGSVGFVVKGAEFEVIGKDGKPAERGTVGVVRVKTDVMSDGYAGAAQPQARSSFRDGWFYPGDLGVIHEDGLIAIAGRMSDTINVSGTKLPALDIENSLAGLSGVEDICALSLPLDSQDLLAIAVVCDKDVDQDYLKSECAAKLPKNLNFVVLRVQRIPRNAMGKVMRSTFARRLAETVKPRGKQRQLQDS